VCIVIIGINLFVLFAPALENTWLHHRILRDVDINTFLEGKNTEWFDCTNTFYLKETLMRFRIYNIEKCTQY
jgi:hypothetical protein